MAIRLSEEFVKRFGKKFPAESVLVRQGEIGSTMFVIYRGKVVIYIATSVGEKNLATLSDGDFFGEMALVGTVPERGASVKCVEETVVLELNREAFESFIRRSPEMAMAIIKTLAERVRDSNSKTASLIHKEDFLRIASYLQALCKDRGKSYSKESPGRVFSLQIEAVAAAIGVKPEKLNEFVAIAHKAKILGQNGMWVYISQPKYLQPLAKYILSQSI